MRIQINPQDRPRMQKLSDSFRSTFGTSPSRYFSAPGRTEICGNHTDHQRGIVLAAAVNLDAIAAVEITNTGLVQVQSEGYPRFTVALNDLLPHSEEYNTTLSLIRGVTSEFVQKGCRIPGVDIYVTSQVLPGSGLSSSAAFEVLLGTIYNELFLDGAVSAPEIARIAQYAENVYFGKPCGLMDQMASAVGNLVQIDFYTPDNPVITPVAFDFSATGYVLCIIDSQASHADLTDAYAAIPQELGEICRYFGKEVLSQIPERDFYAAIPALRKGCGDRAVLRAVHFYQENARVLQASDALRQGNFDLFLSILRQSGYSSCMYLQNVTPTGAIRQQDMAITLALCAHYLEDSGAYRVHGGGFAGTCQAFVPEERLEYFRQGIDGVLGAGACHVLSIRPYGGVELEAE